MNPINLLLQLLVALSIHSIRQKTSAHAVGLGCNINPIKIGLDIHRKIVGITFHALSFSHTLYVRTRVVSFFMKDLGCLSVNRSLNDVHHLLMICCSCSKSSLALLDRPNKHLETPFWCLLGWSSETDYSKPRQWGGCEAPSRVSFQIIESVMCDLC